MAEVSSISSDNTSSPKTPHLAFTTVSNIKLHIPIQLSISEPNYKKWSKLFRLLALRFNLMGFLDGTNTAASDDDVEWLQFDALLQGWILSTVTDEVSDLVLANSPSAHSLWTAIYKLFHDNKHARAMQLEHRFRTTVKGNRTINEYCHLLKNLADYLDDVDALVTEHALVLQVLQGLPQDIRAQVTFLQYQTPFPTFLEVRSALLLVEQQQTNTTHGADSSTALFSTGSGGGSPAAGGQQRQAGGLGRGYGSFLLSLGFRGCKSDTSLFTYGQGSHMAFLLLYVDDIILIASTQALLQKIIQRLKGEFAMTDMGDLHFFLGINVQRTTHGLFLTQTQFLYDILDRAGMLSCKSASTPVDTRGKLSASARPPAPDPSMYRSIVGALQLGRGVIEGKSNGVGRWAEEGGLLGAGPWEWIGLEGVVWAEGGSGVVWAERGGDVG
ncbi:unnamed protein product [Cuscuta campestris]|uniref:Reverse transcriptase Ty1/copia-type domain-containing protein n=1 Tax=Cuscuta campestris TaxID=132261 RepID=A0A484LIK4_9ASTE|nr:unnamed protein product [Cuscuta campestris]